MFKRKGRKTRNQAARNQGQEGKRYKERKRAARLSQRNQKGERSVAPRKKKQTERKE